MMQNVGRQLSPPVHYSEFWNALRAILPGPQGPGKSAKQRIGIAVSGGLDSMALARLCIGQRCDSMYNAEFHAFVVDHKARAGSAEEAKLVASRLQEFGLKSTILPLQWPSEVKPAELSNFESEARRLRYQALGQACRDEDIQSLLLAHHSDDQAETIFLRLVKGHKGWRMKGMQASAEIPECWGLHGVHQSGMRVRNPFSKAVNHNAGSHSDHGRPKTTLEDHRTENNQFPFDLEEGGVKIYRPLLRFSKERLRTTCLHQRVPWVEDETNQDPTRTPRNAVRQLLNSGKLPKALQKGSLLASAVQVESKRLENVFEVEDWFRRTQILVFDVRSGVLVVRVPAHAISNEHVFHKFEAYGGREVDRSRHVAALFLRRLVEFVCPRETVSLQQLEVAVDSIFPDLDNPEATAVVKRLKAPIFTAGGVRCERLETPIEKHQKMDGKTPVLSKQRLDPDFVWFLSRQPEYPGSSILIPPSSPPFIATNPELPPSPPSFSRWHLFDGRYWIRVAHTSSRPLQIRFLRQEDMHALHDAFPLQNPQRYKQRHYYWQRMKGAAPGKIRFTLPVIAEAGEGGRMLAIATLAIVLPGVLEQMGLRWEVRYKKVDWGARGVRGWELQLRMGKGIVKEKKFVMKKRGVDQGMGDQEESGQETGA